MKPRLRVVIAATVAVASAGCENAVEHLAVEEWREVGSASPPAAIFGTAYSLQTLAPGRGPEVAAGDLVELRVETAGGGERVLSVWTGVYPESDLRGVLGSEALRAALIGRRLGERIAVRRDDSAPEVARLPVGAFMSTVEFPGLSGTADLGGGRGAARQWPSFEFLGGAQAASEWVIEVRAACPARLLHRAATLRQWGYVLELSAAEIAPRREGTLHWLAVEATCADGTRRLDAGPLYDRREPARAQSLFAWEASYARLRPPVRLPAEWSVSPAP